MFQNIFRRLQNFGEVVIDIIKTIFISRGKNATGRTIQSLRRETVFDTDKEIELNIYGAKTFEYIENGRPAGSKLPPQGALIEWMQARGIPLEKEFAVRKSIAKNGIAPEPIIELSFIQVQRQAGTLSEKILNELTDTIVKAIKQDFKFN